MRYWLGFSGGGGFRPATLSISMTLRIKAAPRRPLLWLCGLVSVALVIFAYILAVAIAVALGFLSIALIGSGVATLIILSLGAITCAISIVLSILPRPDRFSPPSPSER